MKLIGIIQFTFYIKGSLPFTFKNRYVVSKDLVVFKQNFTRNSPKLTSYFFLSYRKPGPTPTKQRNTKYWSEKYPETSTQISRQEVKLQEAIFELSTGEEDLVQDMNLLRKTYAETMVRFKILNQAEADLVFGKLYPIIPLHNSLACALSR